MLQGPCSRTDEHPAAIKPQPAERPHTSTKGKPSANQVRQLALERLNVSCLLRVENDVRLEPRGGQLLLATTQRHQADVMVPLVVKENDAGQLSSSGFTWPRAAVASPAAGAASGSRCAIGRCIAPLRSSRQWPLPRSWWSITPC
jgi:hypothetical protein